MNQTLSYKTLVLHPTAANLVTDRYKWLSLPLAEPSLGVPSGTGMYYLTGKDTGERGWSNNFNFTIDTTLVEAITGIFNVLVIKDRLSSFATQNIFDTDSSYPAVRITQRGTGHSFLVEDSTNPDSSPFIINNVGQILIGTLSAYHTTASLQINSDSSLAPNGTIAIRRNVNDETSSQLQFWKARGTIDSPTITQNNDTLGTILFGGYIQDTVSDSVYNFRESAFIRASVDGAPVISLSSTPSRLVFNTTISGSNYSTEKMRIDSQGRVGIGTTSPNELLTVTGTISSYNLKTNTLTANIGLITVLSSVSATIDNLKSNRVTSNLINSVDLFSANLTANTGYITVLSSVSATIDNLKSNRVTSNLINSADLYTANLTANTGYITVLSSVSATIDNLKNNRITSNLINSTDLFTNNLTANTGYITVLSSVSATIDNLKNNRITSNLINSADLYTVNLTANTGYITVLSSVSATIDNLKSNRITTDILNAATVNGGTGNFTSLTALSATINVIDISYYELSGFNVTGNVTISGDLFVTGKTTLNTLTAQNIYTNTVDMSAVVFTNNIQTTTSVITATDTYIKVIINGKNKYLRLFDL